jgi:hypothetical protein
MANNHSRNFVYWYLVKIWKWVLILLTFECLIEGGIVINIIIVILQAFHPTLFMAIYGYSQLFLVIFGYFTLSYFWLF